LDDRLRLVGKLSLVGRLRLIAGVVPHGKGLKIGFDEADLSESAAAQQIGRWTIALFVEVPQQEECRECLRR
jgi:hypothetical protein